MVKGLYGGFLIFRIYSFTCIKFRSKVWSNFHTFFQFLGQLDEAAKLADVASQIAQKLVELKAPGVKKENAEVLQTEADEAIRAAMAEDKLGFERALSAMEHQLEKILENLENLVKDKEQELKNSSEDVAPMELACKNFELFVFFILRFPNFSIKISFFHLSSSDKNAFKFVNIADLIKCDLKFFSFY